MKFTLTKILAAGLLLAGCQHPSTNTTATSVKDSITTVQWKILDISRRKPMVVEPMSQTLSAPAPNGAVIIFKSGDLSGWTSTDSSAAKWNLEGDYMEVVPGTGAIISKESFGDIFYMQSGLRQTTPHIMDRIVETAESFL